MIRDIIMLIFAIQSRPLVPGVL